MKIGILGFAHGHVGMYCSRWRKEPALDIQVACGWDHDAERLRQAAKNLEARPCASPEDLLSEPGLEAVVIGAETSLHAELTEKAAAAGKTIVVQKPLALTPEQADRMVAAVRRHDVPFSLAWQMRTDPENLKMRELLGSGQFGKVFMVRRRHCLGMILTNPSFRTMWHLKPEYNRDIWADDAAHPIDFLYWLFGMPETVTAELGTLYDPVQPNDNGIAVYRYPNGMIAEVSSSFTCLAGENTTEITAERGVIIQNYGDGPSSGTPRQPGTASLKWYLHGGTGWVVSDAPGMKAQGDRILHLAGPLSEFLHGRRPPIATVEEGRDVLRMVLACYESSEKGRRVKLA
jgi:predicted dehydrogenase